VGWNDCAAKGGTVNTDFACNDDQAVHSVVVSFQVDQPITGIVAITSIMLVSTIIPCDGPGPCQGPTLPSWWQFEIGGCHQNFATYSTNFTVPPYSIGNGCTNPWFQKSPVSNTSITYPTPSFPVTDGTDRMRIQTVSAVAPGEELAVDPGTEYYAFHLDVGGI